MTRAFVMPAQLLHGLELFAALRTMISVDFVNSAAKMAQNVAFVVTALRAVLADEHSGAVVIIHIVFIPNLVVRCRFSYSHSTLLLSAAFPSANHAMQNVTPVNLLNV